MAIVASAQELEQAILSPERREFFDSSLRTNEGERRALIYRYSSFRLAALGSGVAPTFFAAMAPRRDADAIPSPATRYTPKG